MPKNPAEHTAVRARNKQISKLRDIADDMTRPGYDIGPTNRRATATHLRQAANEIEDLTEWLDREFSKTVGRVTNLLNLALRDHLTTESGYEPRIEVKTTGHGHPRFQMSATSPLGGIKVTLDVYVEIFEPGLEH